MQWNYGRFARKSIRPTAFARTLVDSPDDIKHSTTWWTYLSRYYFSYSWFAHVQSLSFHAFPLFSGLKTTNKLRRIDLIWANCYRANWLSGETTWYRAVQSRSKKWCDKHTVATSLLSEIVAEVLPIFHERCEFILMTWANKYLFTLTNQFFVPFDSYSFMRLTLWPSHSCKASCLIKWRISFDIRMSQSPKTLEPSCWLLAPFEVHSLSTSVFCP